MSISRRQFIKHTGLGLSASILPFGNIVLGQPSGADGKTLVVVYLRGGADGLQMVAPVGRNFDTTFGHTAVGSSYSRDYFATDSRLRDKFFDPTKDGNDRYLFRTENGGTAAAGTAENGIELDGNFELHPQLSELAEFFNGSNKIMSIVHGVGGVGSRSHFVAQDAMEWAHPNGNGQPGSDNGWLHESIQQMGWSATPSPLTGVSFGSTFAQSFAGSPQQSEKLVSFPSIDAFNLHYDDSDPRFNVLSGFFNSSNSSYRDISKSGSSAFQAIAGLSATTANPQFYDNALGNAGFNQDLQDAARLIAGGFNVKAINIDVGGWDTHQQELGSIANNKLFRKISVGLKGFYDDLAARSDANNDFVANTCTLVISEFGRNVNVNGNDGTDHGDGGVAFVLGGGITGGQIIVGGEDTTAITSANQWYAPSSANNQEAPWNVSNAGTSYERWYLQDNNDFRSIYCDILRNHFGISNATDLETIFDVSVGDLSGFDQQFSLWS